MGHTIGGILQLCCIIWSIIGVICYFIAKPLLRKENQHNNLRGNLFPRVGATYDFFRYEHIIERDNRHAKKVFAYVNIPANKEDRRKYYEETNLISKRKKITDKKSEFEMVKF